MLSRNDILIARHFKLNTDQLGLFDGKEWRKIRIKKCGGVLSSLQL